ncbi:MAG: hypothetical protein LBU50_04935 [Cellulomonas sp.]|jgi:hypothetical protein|nr:hypothetical protein [Cellulomonas sp.]
MAAATEVRDALRDEDYEALAAMVSPDENVVFAPHANFVDESTRLSPQEVRRLGTSSTVYSWTDRFGDPFEMDFADYRDYHVWDRDFDDAPYVTVDDYHTSGDADLDPGWWPNVAEYFGSTAHWVEYCFPAQGEGEAGTALYLVFRETATGYYLIGINHNEWVVGAG